MDTEMLRANLRRVRFIGKAAFISAVKLRDGQKLSPGSILEDWAAKQPGHDAILFEDERISYGELNARANQVAHALVSIGAKAGDVVAIVMDNRPEYLEFLLGANKVGVCIALINCNLVGQPLIHAITIGGASFVLVGAEHASKVEDVAGEIGVARERILVRSDRGVNANVEGARSFDELLAKAPRTNPPTTLQDIKNPFVYIYTSGTTGLPKASKQTNSRYLKAAFLFGQAVIGVRTDDVIYGSGAPLYHSSGTVLGFGSALTGGATFGLRRKFSVRGHWDDCARWNVTVFTYIGELCRYLMNGPQHPRERDHKIRAITGAGLRPDIWEAFQKRFAIPVVYEFYGATEGNVGIVNIDGRPGMMGRLMPGQCVLAADPHTGELLLDANKRARKAEVGERGLLVGHINRMNTFDGYVDKGKNESKIVRNPFGDGKDFFNTGDLVELHDHGYVSFKDRLGDTFRWKGENVSTNEVQEVLNRCPGVEESNVYGVEVPGADGRAGMVALVVGENFDVVEFGHHVRTSLPVYARPVFLRVQPEMQTTGTFKHVKTELKAASFDPAKVDDALYFFENGERYTPLTPELYARITSRELKL
ncbi:MAG: long-chain-acyl-CoA synthetase [Polyangiales bacterium]